MGWNKIEIEPTDLEADTMKAFKDNSSNAASSISDKKEKNKGPSGLEFARFVETVKVAATTVFAAIPVNRKDSYNSGEPFASWSADYNKDIAA